MHSIRLPYPITKLYLPLPKDKALRYLLKVNSPCPAYFTTIKKPKSISHFFVVDFLNVDSLKGLGNTRIQATIGTQKSQSNSGSYTEVNQGSSITTNNLALIATGGGTDPITGSNININGSTLNVSNNALFQADNDFNINGVAQNSS